MAKKLKKELTPAQKLIIAKKLFEELSTDNYNQIVVYTGIIQDVDTKIYHNVVNEDFEK